MKRLLALMIVAICLPVLSATNYIRVGATGSGNGSDWANAWTSFSAATWTRGNTYMVGGPGSYASYNFNAPLSGSSMITVLIASTNNHGTSVGWLDAYAVRPRIVAPGVGPNGNYYFDGQTGGDPSSPQTWTNNLGLFIDATNGPVYIYQNTTNVTFKRFEIIGNGVNTGAGTSCGFRIGVENGPGDNGAIWVTNSYGYIHEVGNCPWQARCYYHDMDHVWVGNYDNDDGSEHCEIYAMWQGHDVYFRNCVFTRTMSTGGIMFDNNAWGNWGPDTHCQVSGCLFALTTGSHASNGLVGTWGGAGNEVAKGIRIFNNTFYNIDALGLQTINFQNFNGTTNIFITNNLFYASTPNFSWTINGIATTSTHGYNHFVNSGSVPGSDLNGTSASGNPFNNPSAMDFSLTANTPSGLNLGSQFTPDWLGNARSTWTRGALEFQGGTSGPSIATQPSNIGVQVGSTATFNVSALGTSPLAYQWNRAGTNVSGATLSSYTTPAVAIGDNGQQFYVVVTNNYGSVTSSTVTLTVTNSSGGLGLTYYASPSGSSGNSGTTQGSPWPLPYALANAGASNTIILLDGQYSPSPMVVSAQYQTIKALNKWGAIITNVTGSYSFTVSPATGYGATFDGIAFKKNQFALEVVGVSNCVVRNCWFTDTGEGFAGSQAASGLEAEGWNLVIEKNLSERNARTAGTGVHNHGLYVGGTNIVVRGNVCRFNEGYGISVYSAANPLDNVQVYENLVYDNQASGIQSDQVAFNYTGSMVKTNSCFSNTIITTNGSYALLLCASSTYGVTNNLIVATGEGIHTFANSGTPVVLADYNFSTNGLSSYSGPHDITNSPGFVNPASGLYWLRSDSAARGKALSTVFGSVDFFGNSQSSVVDCGAFKFDSVYAADVRTLEPSPTAGADYWASATTANSNNVAITVQPVSQVVGTTSNATFTVTATGQAPLTYTWTFNGSVIGSNSSSYTRNNCQSGDNGAVLQVTITNVLNSVQSSVATLTVTNSNPGGILAVNPSSRDFGMIPTNTTLDLSLTLTNSGPGSVSGVATVSTPFSVVGGSPYNLPANTATNVIVRYSPTAAAVDAQTLSFSGDGAVSAALNGLSYIIQPSLSFSATNGTISAPFTVANGILSQVATTSYGSGGQAIYGVNIPLSGTYYIMSVSEAPSLSQNSFWIDFDQQPADPTATWDITNVTSFFANNPVSWRGSGGPESPQFRTNVWTLTPGLHRLVLRGREGGTLLQNLNILSTSAVPVPPSITAQPSSLTVTQGQTADFSIGASGTLPLAYQWTKGTTPLASATLSSYSFVTGAGDVGSTNYYCIVTNTAGSITSSPALLTVNPSVIAPSITSSPTNVSAYSGQGAAFYVSASGTAPLAYQWTFGGSVITGATNTSYVVVSLQNGDNGKTAFCVVTNSGGSATSAVATITIVPAPIGPSIITQPTNQVVGVSSNAIWAISAVGDSPLSYQWFFNNVPVGTNGPAYLRTNCQLADGSGLAYCSVSNAVAVVNSQSAMLTVTNQIVLPSGYININIGNGQPGTGKY